jgi:hypothetical protein
MAVPIDDKYKVWLEEVEKDYPRLEFSCELEGWDRVLGEACRAQGLLSN